MEHNLNQIQFKKPIFPVNGELNEYLTQQARNLAAPVAYADLMRYQHLVPKLAKDGSPTHWNSVLYTESEMEELNTQLVDLYQLLIADGVHLDYLRVDSIDFCAYGNSQPFRIKILNQINDNYDYYYIKKADASRVYGLELEHYLSPNKINYLYYEQTLVEEHIIGIPGDDFMERWETQGHIHNAVRLAKEFVKFNERCFVQLLGDMRAYNWVVVVNQDFDQMQYRIRCIDFDQQSYEGRHRMYLPQFYKENLPYVLLTQNNMSIATAGQYVNEEQALLRKRYAFSEHLIKQLLGIMKRDQISKPEYVKMLGRELTKFHSNPQFAQLTTMGDLLEENIKVRLKL